MSKNTVNKIITKLERLGEYLAYLKEIQKVNKKSFVNDYHFYGLAERYLQLAIEVAIDIGKLLVIASNLPRPNDNQEIFVILRDRKIISENLAGKFEGIAGFRNILVHDYEKIDRGVVYDKLENNLEDFADFRKAVSKFLKKSL